MKDGSAAAVIGAGIVGVCIAYALRTRGIDVTLIDRDKPGQGCSYGNSGAISPGSAAPLALLGVLASLLERATRCTTRSHARPHCGRHFSRSRCNGSDHVDGTSALHA